MTRKAGHVTCTTAVILKGYPRLSETFIAQELLGLEQMGHKLVLFSMRQPRDSETHPVHDEIQAPVVYLPEYLHNEPWRVMRAIARLMWRPAFWSSLAGGLGDLMREPTRNRIRRFGQACVLAAELPADTDRLYAHFIHTPAAVTNYASTMSGLPWTCSAHAKDIWTSPDWDLKAKLKSARWVATCTRVGHAHLQSLAPSPERVNLIYHGFDLERFAHVDRPLSTRDGANADDPVALLSVGRAVEKKGFDTLLDALARLPASLHWTWTHIGNGDDLDALKAQCRKLGLDDRVRWLGAQAQSLVLDCYRTSDIFILPCRIAENGDRDGLPNVLVEAQSQGLSCISTPVSAVPELIDSEERGVLVPPNDPVRLAAAIERLARNPELRASIGRAGEARVRAAFDHTAGIRQLDRLFAGMAHDAHGDRNVAFSRAKSAEILP